LAFGKYEIFLTDSGYGHSNPILTTFTYHRNPPSLICLSVRWSILICFSFCV